MRPNFRLHTHETVSGAITRLYKHLRAIKPEHKPQSEYAARIELKRALKPKLRLIK